MLQIVKSTSYKRPWRICAYGPEGTGKTTFAAGFPKPLFIPCEEGVSRLGIEVDCLPVPTCFADVLKYLDEFPMEQGYRTIVIDTVDSLEALIHRQVLEESKATSLELAYGGFGKGYNVATEKFREVLKKLDVLRNKGLQVVLLGHTIAKLFNNPAGPDYMRYELSLHKGSAVQGPGPVVKAWVDCLMFVNFDDMVKVEAENAGDPLAKGKAITGRRCLYTQHTAAYDAKSPGLPPKIELSYDKFNAEVVKLAKGATDAAPPKPAVAKAVAVASPPTAATPSAVPAAPAEAKPTIKEILDDVTSIITPEDVDAMAGKLTLKHVQAGLTLDMKVLGKPTPELSAQFIKPHGVNFSRELKPEQWPLVLKALITEFAKSSLPFKIPV